jgi:DNA repair protein RadC
VAPSSSTSIAAAFATNWPPSDLASGPRPSPEDLAFIRRVAEAGEIVAVPILDQIVVGDEPVFVSLKQLGGWREASVLAENPQFDTWRPKC